MGSDLGTARKLYSHGVEMLKQENYADAGEAITRASEMGDAMAQCHLGFLYENGFFDDPDDKEAVRWYRKAADQCLPHGLFRLGACYQLGRGVEQNYEEAARLFELAAKMGHTDAAQALTCLREMGLVSAMPELPSELDDPAVRDAIAAYQWQAMQNQPASQLKLGLAYHLGHGAPKHPKLACFWVMRAMLAGDHRAAKYLEYCTRGVPPEQHGALQGKIFMWTPGQPLPEL